jgi:hypothetical protein
MDVRLTSTLPRSGDGGLTIYDLIAKGVVEGGEAEIRADL